MSDFYERLEVYDRADDTEGRSILESQIWDEFGVHQAIFVLDMAGFTRHSERRGIVHYLSLIQRMRLTLEPVVVQYGGDVVKFEADNCFARFPSPVDAIRTGITYNRMLATMNLTTPGDLDIHASVGIDYGEILLVEGKDFWGTPVNFASKLGEDTAQSGEILVTKRAMDHVPPTERIATTPVNLSVAGIELDVVRVNY